MGVPEWFKEHGSLSVVAALLVLVGAPVAAHLSPKSLFDVDTIKYTPTQLIGLVMVLIGVILFWGALSAAKKASAGAERRLKGYRKIRTILDQHYALDPGDKPHFLIKVRGSAIRLRGEMDEISKKTNDDGIRNLAKAISSQAAHFVRNLENIEKQVEMDFDSTPNIKHGDLPESHWQDYLNAHQYWQNQTNTLDEGAGLILGFTDRFGNLKGLSRY